MEEEGGAAAPQWRREAAVAPPCRRREAVVAPPWRRREAAVIVPSDPAVTLGSEGRAAPGWRQGGGATPGWKRVEGGWWLRRRVRGVVGFPIFILMSIGGLRDLGL